MQLRTSLYSIVIGLFLLVLVAAGLGWYSHSQVETVLATAGVGAAGIKAVSTELSSYMYVFIALLILAVLLLVWAIVFVNRRIVQPLSDAIEHVEQVAAGDLTQRVEFDSSNEVGALYEALSRLQDNVSRLVVGVRSGMTDIAQGSDQIFQGNTDLSSRTEQQAAALQQTASSLEELASTVKQNADNAQQANQMAANASDVAQRGGQAVGEVVSTMQGISASSSKISDIVGVIDSIAFQTNILALNAAVEAARAGEQGKGFAVVASEVRALAQRSAAAAKEIKDLIEDSVRKVAEGSNQVERAGTTMHDIVESVAKVTDIMGEISAATREQAAGIDQINRAVSQMDLVTQQNAALVEQSANSASSLRDRAAGVADIVASFKVLQRQVIDMPAQSRDAQRAAAVSSNGAPARRQAAGALNAPAQEASLSSARLPKQRVAAVTSAASRSSVSAASSIGHSATAGQRTARSAATASHTQAAGTAKDPSGTKPSVSRPATSARTVEPPAANEPLLRPDLSASGTRPKKASADDDWEEF